MPLSEARKNEEVISLADSQMLRWIDNLNGVMDADTQTKEIMSEIKKIKKETYSRENAKKVAKLYADIDNLQFKPDYMCLIIDKEKDYYRACQGFTINGIKYKRLLGTNGGIKNSTIVFVSDRLYDDLTRRIENGRDPDKELVTAKLEAYKSLTCSASEAVSFPKGILVVPDAETKFYEDIMFLSDEDNEEPVLEYRENQEIVNDASDGFGLMLPSLAERWGNELNLGYVPSGCNTRFSFEKGMVFTFDFVEFAKRVAGSYIVKDAWGNDVDVRNVELILTTSMVKLWDSYESCDDYVSKSLSNEYTFGVTKTCPETLESERTLNYQFIQSYDLDDDDIDELIAPTVNEIRDVLGGDWRKAVLFMRGETLSEKNVMRQQDSYSTAIMINPNVLDDPFIRQHIHRLIRFKIDRAKIGVIKVHGNYSIVSGDPYLLCESIFGMTPVGLLKKGQIYNKYWVNAGSKNLVCFRAPMTTHSNIRAVEVTTNDDIAFWYQHMKTCTILNAWDSAPNALNGCDFDGDLVMLTDNKVLVSKHKPLPTLMCIQRRAKKKVSTSEDFIKSNIESFGNEIGQTTNWITGMFEVRDRFQKDSKEYKTLCYRIQCGQLFQQNAIDKAKGIICNPMPKKWHDRHTLSKLEEDESVKNFYRHIVADKKPYFMIYIYPDLKREYNQFVKNANKNSLREFGMTVDKLKEVPKEELTDRQKDFLKQYKRKIPVGTSDCVMNRLCRKIEKEFGSVKDIGTTSTKFDYSILGTSLAYPQSLYYKVKSLYDEYNRCLLNYSTYMKSEKVSKSDAKAMLADLKEEFTRECLSICPNEEMLCNIMLTFCYQKNTSKSFVWDICGKRIIENLLSANNKQISIPIKDDDGDIEYGGKRFSVLTTTVQNEEERNEEEEIDNECDFE